MPVLAYMCVGYVLKRIKVMGKELTAGINGLVFRVFIPVLLFYNIANSDLSQSFRPELVAISVGSVIVVFVLGLLIVPRFVKDKSKSSVMVQGMFRTNVSIYGPPVALAIAGDAAMGEVSLLIAIGIPVSNMFGVIIFEVMRGNNISFAKIIKGIVTNPLIIGCVLGLIVSVSSIQITGIISKIISDLAGIATPLALIVLGASLHFVGIKSLIPHICVVTIARLIVVPLISLAIGIAMGINGPALAALTAYCTAPTSVTSFSTAQAMGGDSLLAGQIVVFTSVFSVLTVFLFVFSLSSAGLF